MGNYDMVAHVHATFQITCLTERQIYSPHVHPILHMKVLAQEDVKRFRSKFWDV